MKIKPNILKALILLVLILSADLFGQNDDKVLVKLNGDNILESEFKYRLDFTPKEGIQDKSSSDGIKKEVLYTMIAERLWALEAIENGYESKPSVITARNVIEKMLVRDALYNIEIKNKINLSNDEIENGLKQFDFSRITAVFYSEKENELMKISSLLNSGADVDSIIQNLDTLNVIHKTLPIFFGDLDKFTEKIVFELKPNQYTPIIEMNGANRIYYIRNIVKNDDADNNISEKYKKVVKILKERQENTNYDLFYKKFFADKKVSVNGKLFDLLTGKLLEIFREKEKNKLLSIDENGNKRFLFDSYDVKKIEEDVPAELLGKSFIEFENDPIDLKTFMREISFSAFSVSAADADSINNSLDKKTKEYIKYELLAREGYKQGLNELPSVKKWVNIWNRSFLYQSIKNDFYAKEADNDVEQIGGDDENGKRAFKNFIDSTIKLVHKYGYEVNEDLFSKIKQGNINLFVVRHLGFGGTITGVPTSYPFLEWFLEMKKNEKEKIDNVL